MKTAFELQLDQVEAVLQAAGLAVLRHLVNPPTADECPLVVLRRGPSNPVGQAQLGRVRQRLQLLLHFCVAGAEWETAADELHQAAHAALLTDAQLAQAGIELTATQANPGQPGEVTVGEVAATYALEVFADAFNLSPLQ